MEKFEKDIKALMDAKDNEGLVRRLIDLYLSVDLKGFNEDVMYDLFIYTMDHFDYGKYDQYILLSDSVALFSKAIGTMLTQRLHYEVTTATLFLMGDFEKAHEMMVEYIDFCMKNGFERYEFMLLGNKLTLELELKDYPAAKETLNRMESLPFEGPRTVFHVNSVRYLLENHITEGVLPHLDEAMAGENIKEEYGNYVEAHLYYAKYYMMIGEKDLSLEWYKKTIGLIEKFKLGFSERRVYKELADMLSNLGMYKESNDYLRHYCDLLTVGENDFRTLQSRKSRLERFIAEKEMENKQLQMRNEAIEMENNLDFLTGIYNRRFITNHLNELLDMTEENKNFSVLIFDVDDFKSINDMHGHLAGDYIIREVATTVKDLLKDQYVIARTGGDEFIICFEDLNKLEAQKISEEIRITLEKTDYTYEGKTINVTISGGISDTVDIKERNYSNVLMSADHKLYASKKQGKNVIVY